TTPAAGRAGMPAAGRSSRCGGLDSLRLSCVRRVSRRRDLCVDGEGAGRRRRLPTGSSAGRAAADQVPAPVPGVAGAAVEAGAGVPGEPAAVEGTVALVRSGDAGPGLSLPRPLPL